jgi:hypothetical protein
VVGAAAAAARGWWGGVRQHVMRCRAGVEVAVGGVEVDGIRVMESWGRGKAVHDSRSSPHCTA